VTLCEVAALVWLDQAVPDLESLSRGELVELARAQAIRIDEQAVVIARQNAQITVLFTQLADLMDKFEQQTGELAKLRHLLSRNSANSSMPSSKDDDPGRTPPGRERRAKPGGRAKGKQKGASGSMLRWREEDELDGRLPRFPEGACSCGADLAGAADLGVVDQYQQHEVPLVSVTVIQYDQHAVACACGKVHTAARPEGAGAGRSEYGPNLRAFAVYLMVWHFVPVGRVVEILANLTGATPSTGFVHAPLARASQLLRYCDFAIRTLITLAFAVCVDETPLKVGSATPAEGRKEAGGYLHVACTELYTHFLLADRSMASFKATVLQDLEPGAVIVATATRTTTAADSAS
jgi:transposase